MFKFMLIFFTLIPTGFSSNGDPIDRVFYHAVCDGNIALVEEMIQKDPSKIDGTNRDYTPLNWAAENGQVEMVKYLISKGAIIDSRNTTNYTPLHRACSRVTQTDERERVFCEVAKILIENGADINARGGISALGGHGYSFTPLHKAIVQGNQYIIKLLIEKGADVNAKDYEGKTPLFKAATFYKPDILKLLIENGADVNAMSKSRRYPTPIFKATGGGKVKILEVLIEHGANLFVKNDKRDNPYEFALRIKRKKAAEFLRKAMEKQTGKKIRPKTVNPGKHRLIP